MSIPSYFSCQTRSITSLVFTGVMLLAGCGQSGPPMASVTGTVTYDGAPLPNGTITFVPLEQGMPFAYAEVAADGTYTAAVPDVGNGVPIGEHRVMISAVKDMGPEAPVELMIPTKYSSDQTSGLTASVKEGGNVINFDLQSK